MRKLIMWNVITLDGYFEGENKWELPFHETIWCDELEKFSLEQLYAADCLVFGRITYEGMASYWIPAEGAIADKMNQLAKIVFSRTLTEATWNNSILIKEDVVAAIKKLKSEGKGDMYVFGSAHLSSTLMQHDLFDEYRIAIAPVILGKGLPLFPKNFTSKQLKLISTQQLETGGVILFYKPIETVPG